jgi:hypothetical protein
MKLLASLLVMIALCGCVSKTEFGECIGITDDKNPQLVYKVSARNVVIGIIFFEVIVPPVVVLVDETYCPVAAK